MTNYYLGIDIGSTTFKAVLLTSEGEVKHSVYERTKPIEGSGGIVCSGYCNSCGQCNFGALKKAVTKFIQEAGLEDDDITSTVVTGSQITESAEPVFKYDYFVSEVSAHVAGALHYHPEAKAILDVGGQDSKAMLYSDDMNTWVSRMSGICAAGTGAFLDSVADKLNIPIENMAELVNYNSDLEVSSVCAVLNATSVNKFKNRFPLGDVIDAACRAQARTIMSGVGELLYECKTPIVFQGGVASNQAVAYYLKQVSGNEIIIPPYHQLMGALGAACLARQHSKLLFNGGLKYPPFENEPTLKSVGMRAKQTRREFLSRGKEPLVWRNLFFPAEILNAFGVRMLTLETYAALFSRNQKKMARALDAAAYKGFAAETCTFLRVLEGLELPRPDFAVSTSEPCQQGERVFVDLARTYGFEDDFYSLNTPLDHSEDGIEKVAGGLREAVERMEKAIGAKLDPGHLAEACHLSNQARHAAIKCNRIRWENPPLLRGTKALYFSAIFSQLWGKRELVDIHQQFYRELLEQKEKISSDYSLEDTHRLLWLHLPPFYDTRLLDYLEITCNAPIVFEEVNFVNWAPLDPDDPYRSLARKLLTVGFLDPSHRVELIKQNAPKINLDGCVLYNHGFGRCSMADSFFVRHLRDELRKIGLPLLVLDGDCVDRTTDPCSTYTKISSYVESLNHKRYGNIFGRNMEHDISVSA